MAKELRKETVSSIQSDVKNLNSKEDLHTLAELICSASNQMQDIILRDIVSKRELRDTQVDEVLGLSDKITACNIALQSEIFKLIGVEDKNKNIGTSITYVFSGLLRLADTFFLKERQLESKLLSRKSNPTFTDKVKSIFFYEDEAAIVTYLENIDRLDKLRNKISDCRGVVNSLFYHFMLFNSDEKLHLPNGFSFNDFIEINSLLFDLQNYLKINADIFLLKTHAKNLSFDLKEQTALWNDLYRLIFNNADVDNEC